MYPSISLICDPDPGQARARVAAMLQDMGAWAASGVRAAVGDDWAAAVVPPPAREPTSGADICHDEADILLWSGEMFLPAHWAPPRRADLSPAAISRCVLNRLRTQGREALADIDGAFCGAWYEGRSRRWMVFNDRLGLIPLFWTTQGQRLVVANRAAFAWRASAAPLHIDPQGIADLIRTENMTGDHTLIEGVHWLKRSHVLLWQPGLWSCERNWDFQPREWTLTTDDQAIESYCAALNQAITRHAVTDAPLYLGITGGLDSRLFLAMCEAIGCVPICFTCGLPFSEDVRFGRKLAYAAGAAHEWVPLRDTALAQQLHAAIIATDGLHSAAHMANAASALEYLHGRPGAVVLEGFLHGMVGGCSVARDEEITGRPFHQSEWARALLHAGGSLERIDSLLEPRFAAESRQQWIARVDDAYAHAIGRNPVEKAEYALTSARLGRIDTVGTALLRREVLVRNPATDRVMIEWHQSVPPPLRAGRRIYVETLRRCFPRFARVQRSNSSALPIAESRWLREYHWQRDRLWRWWAGRRYPIVRRYGTDGNATQAWTCESWRRSGQLDILGEPNARVLQWVQRDALLAMYDRIAANPLDNVALLSLATIEVMIRWLERYANEARPADNATLEKLRFEQVGRTQSVPEHREAVLSSIG